MLEPFFLFDRLECDLNQKYCLCLYIFIILIGLNTYIYAWMQRNVGLRLGGGRRSIATASAKKHDDWATLKAELAPVYMVCGMVAMAVAIGSHTAFQQLARSPTVHINKKRRESMPEVSDPDRTFNSATKFIDGSFLRKLSHIQDNNPTLHDPSHPNPFTTPRTAHTLKTVGVHPSSR